MTSLTFAIFFPYRSKEKITVGDMIELTDTSNQKYAMLKMNLGGVDKINIINAHNMTLETVQIILVYPTRLGKFDLECDTTESTIDLSTVEKSGDTHFSDEELSMVAQKVEPKGRLLCRVIPK